MEGLLQEVSRKLCRLLFDDKAVETSHLLLSCLALIRPVLHYPSSLCPILSFQVLSQSYTILAPLLCLLHFSEATAKPVCCVRRTVSPDEASSYVETQDDCCVFVEASAKRNIRVDDLFYELFVVAGLPLEMAPNHHKRLHPNFGSPYTLPPPTPSHRSKKCSLSIKRRLSDACGVVAPNVRRPSIRTDLMIMRTKTSLGSGAVGDGGAAGGGGRVFGSLRGLVRGRRRGRGGPNPVIGVPAEEERRCVIQ
ncbi:hypothetical protein ANN_24040 [Periplaneta americana]|uniref:Uncharacterized protein n=1 Tax=Periplaneta americana TaxID=6978 RepID=A0ABQ8S293_PERAM|nr:hypothetical protein ANN_24040 [Periplaneta americana]